jgi:hypothetical protein
MPTQILSAISGVTVYSTKAAALAGSTSGAAYNTWMQAQTSWAGSPILLEYDGWICCEDDVAIQYCPNSSGFITHELKSGTSSGGIVWQTKTTARPCMWNGNTAARGWAYSVTVCTDIVFTPGALACTFDFNYQEGGSQPHDDSTWGLAVGMLAAAVTRFTQGATLLNPRTYTCWILGGQELDLCGNIDTQVHSANNYDGYHLEGPCQYFNVHDCTIRAWDDSVAIECCAVVLPTNFLAPPWMNNPTTWAGGKIAHGRIQNVVMNGSVSGVRFLNVGPSSLSFKWDDIIIDGVSGTLVNTFITCDNYSGVLSDGINYGGSLTVRNWNVDATAGESGYTGRFYFDACTIDNPTFDLPTISGYLTDRATPLFMFTHQCVFNTATGFPNFAHPGELSLIVDDNFHRADSSTVGNGWTDRVGGTYSIVSNQLSANVGSVYLTQNGATATNAQAFLDMVYNSAENHTAVASVRNIGVSPAGQPDYETALQPGAVPPTFGEGSYDYTTGGVNKTVSLTNGHVYRQLAVVSGQYFLGMCIDLNTNTFLCDSCSGYNTSGGYLTPGVTGLATYGVTTTPQLYNRFRSDAVVAAPTLTALALVASAPVGGYIQITSTPTPANAWDGTGVWAVTAGSGTVDQFGRYYGSVSGTVTYTIGSVVGSVSFNFSGLPSPSNLIGGMQDMVGGLTG